MGVWWPLSPIILLASSSLVDTLPGNCPYPLSLSFSFQILSPKRLTLVDTRRTSDGSRSGWSRFAVCGPVRMVVVIPIWHPPSCGRVVVLEGQQHVSVCMSHLDILLKIQKTSSTLTSHLFSMYFSENSTWYVDIWIDSCWFSFYQIVFGVESIANFDCRQTFQKFSTLQLRELFASWWKAWFEKSAALKISSTLWNAIRHGVHSKKWKGSIHKWTKTYVCAGGTPSQEQSASWFRLFKFGFKGSHMRIRINLHLPLLWEIPQLHCHKTLTPGDSWHEFSRAFG